MSSRPRALFRLAVAACGLTLLLWMSLEDRSSSAPAVLGLAVSTLTALGQRPRFQVLEGAPIWVRLLAVALVGSGVGAGAALVAAALMLVKTGWHAHLVPDFSFGMMIEMLRRAPYWAAAGALAGVGLTWAARAVRR